MSYIKIPPDPTDEAGITELTGDVTTPADSYGSAAATIANLAVSSGKLASAVQLNISTGLINNNNLQILSGIGSDVKALPLGSPVPLPSVSLSLTDGYGFFTAVYIPVTSTITGIRLFQITNGDYTADNTNQVGLYSFSGVTATRVATSANNGDLWKAGANNYINAALTTPYAAAAGVYYVGIMRNSSAQVTAPTVALSTSFATSGITSFGTSGVKITWNQGANTELQASYDVSAASNTASVFWAVLY